MPNPTRQEIIDAHDALETLYDLVEALSVTDSETHLARKHCTSVLAALPPKPQPTMAEVEWDDDEHYLAEAEDAGLRIVVMIKPMMKSSEIKCLDLYGGDGCIVYPPAETLTPTGKRYTLTEVQE